MNRFFLKSLIVAAATVVFSSALTAEPLLRFSIPFTFTALDDQFAAGDYLVRSDLRTGTVIMEQKGGQLYYLPAGIPATVSSADVPWRGKLVFHKYGERYFLHRFQRAGETTHEWKPTRTEKEYARATAPVEVAVLLH